MRLLLIVRGLFLTMNRKKKQIIALTLSNIIADDEINSLFNVIPALTENIKKLKFQGEKETNEKRVFKCQTPHCYAEQILRNSDFYLHFRMTKTTFEVLLEVVVTNAGEKNKVVRIPWHKQIMMGLWVLATPDSFRSIGETFGCSHSTAHDCYLRVIEILYTVAENCFAWPSIENVRQHQECIKRKSGFPGVVGYIDGSYINIKAPANPVRYFNRKKEPALILQAVCDQNLKFIDVYFGEVGSLHDARVYSRSPLAATVSERGNQLLPNDGHLLGDSAYVLTTKMMTPYRDNGHLLDEEIHYNNIHARLRSSAIERAFGLMKSKWRRLKYLDMDVIKYMMQHVIACCVLHSFVLVNKDNFALVGENETDDHEVEVFREPVDREAQRKRNYIAAELYDRDLVHT